MAIQKLLKFLLEKNNELTNKYLECKNIEDAKYFKGQIDLITQILKIIK